MSVRVNGAGGGGAPLSDATPAAPGTAAAGTSTSASRGDHVHTPTTAAQAGAVPTTRTVAGISLAADIPAASLKTALSLGAVTATGATAAAARAAVGITSGLDAARPAAGTAGATYFATDTGALYTDTGSAWTVTSNGGGPDRITLAGFSGTAFLRGTNGPTGGKGTTLAVCFYIATLPGATQSFLWSCADASHGWGIALSGPGVTNNAIDLVLNNSGTLFDKQIGGALATGWHTLAVAVASDGLSLAYSIDGAAATTGVSVASGSYVAPLTTNNHTIGGWLDVTSMGIGLEIAACVSIDAVATAAQLAALSADYASGRILTPAALTENFAYRASLVPGYATATGSTVVSAGTTRRTLTTAASLRVALR